jgi:hypothetical protein
MDGIETSKLLDANPELIPQVCSEIESEFFLKGYDICVSPYGRIGKEISITRYGEFRRLFGNITAFKIWLIPDEGRILLKTSVGLYDKKDVPTIWSTYFMPLTRRLVRQCKLNEKALAIATSAIQEYKVTNELI